MYRLISKTRLKMGCGSSNTVKVRPNEERFKLYEPKHGVSLWYSKCREGNIASLLVLLPFLTYDQLNRIEENGSTCLHVACYRNHRDIVIILLICGCDRDIKNRFGLTPLEETTSDEIRNLFSYDQETLQKMSSILYSDLRDDVFTPYNKFIIGHVSIDHVYDAKEMMKAYRTTGITKLYMMQDITLKSYGKLQRIVNDCIPQDHEYYSTAIDCLKTQDPFGLIKLYTLETDFYTRLQENNAEFTAIIFINLAKFRSRAFQGRTYRGIKMAHFDVNAWKWATKKPEHIIEIQTFMSTSESEKIARTFATSHSENKVSVLFTFDFPQICDTAIKLTENKSDKNSINLTQFPNEQEVLVTPYTLFKVISVVFDTTTNWYQIHLTHVPIVC